MYAIYEGIHRLGDSEPLSSPIWAVGILAMGMVLEGLSFRTAVVEARRVKGELGWWTFVRRTKNPELPVVLLEDLGALVGLALALVAVSLAWITGDALYDGLGSIIIGVLLGAIAWLLAVEMKSLIIGEAARESDRRAIESAITTVSTVRRLIDMRTQHLGPDQLLVGAKVEFDGAMDVRELTEAIDVVETAVREAVSSATIVYIEPDVYDPAEVE